MSAPATPEAMNRADRLALLRSMNLVHPTIEPTGDLPYSQVPDALLHLVADLAPATVGRWPQVEGLPGSRVLLVTLAQSWCTYTHLTTEQTAAWLTALAAGPNHPAATVIAHDVLTDPRGPLIWSAGLTAAEAATCTDTELRALAGLRGWQPVTDPGAP